MTSDYTLSDLVDLALQFPEVGAVNFNILHTVLKTLIAELKLNHVRPKCHIETPLLTKLALQKAQLEGKVGVDYSSEKASKGERPRPRRITPTASKHVAETSSKSEGKTREGSESLNTGEETESQLPTGASQEGLASEEPTDHSKSSEEMPENHEDLAGWDEITNQLREVRKSVQLEEDSEILKSVHSEMDSKDPRQVEDAYRWSYLDSRIAANKEGIEWLSELIETINLKKTGSDENRKKRGDIDDDLYYLEERVAELEEARVVFEEDHLDLSDVQKTQKKMLSEIEEVKALGSEIKELKNQIAAKADMKEMEEALALKGDLELVNTKVDQYEFETAIKELGEAIGVLGMKFQKKHEEWNERAEEMWRAIDGKMSRDIFDEAVLKINSRLTALMHGLEMIKKVVDDLLYPDSSGVTRCIACRRPAGISGNKCYDPKNIHKTANARSASSCVHERFLKTVSDALAQLPKLEEPPFSEDGDTVISVPKETSTISKDDNKLPPIDVKRNRSGNSAGSETNSQVPKLPDIKRNETPLLNENGKNGASKTSSQVPKLPDIKRNETTLRPKNQRPPIKYTVPKGRGKEKPDPLKFTKMTLEKLKREEIAKAREQLLQEPSTSSSYPSLPSTESRVSASTNIISDSAGNLQSFAPMRLMQDPLRKQIIVSPPEGKGPTKPTNVSDPQPKGTASSKTHLNQR